MPRPVSLASLATAVPPHRVTQREAAEAAHGGFAARYDDFARLAAVFETSGIRTRHLVRRSNGICNRSAGRPATPPISKRQRPCSSRPPPPHSNGHR